MSLKKIKDVIMDYNINKNRSVFMKTNKPDPDRFFSSPKIGRLQFKKFNF
jgi:hypothetical protein